MLDTPEQEKAQASPQPRSAPEALLLAKLSMPRLARGTPRPRLFELLDEARKRAALWLTAPGGAGKTTLVATYIVDRGVPHLWFQIDKDDVDPATFFYYLGVAVDRGERAEPHLHLPLLTPEYLSDVAGFARRYFRTVFSLLEPGAVLVLDNHEVVGDQPVFHEILRSAIGEVPPVSNLVVISRGDPPPALARQRAIGALAIIDWDDLRLTLEETAMIIGRGRTQEPALVRALHQRSEGWVAGLILLMERMTLMDVRQVFSVDSLNTVFDYFASEFFTSLPDATRDFLMKTALFAHATPVMAAEFTGEARAAEILADLHRRHLFTQRRDLAVSSYQYHDLFREFLLNKGREIYGAEAYADWMRRAARLLIDHQRPEEAIAMLIKVEDWPEATAAVLALAPQLLTQGRAQMLGGWIQQMPEGRVEATPWLLFWKGMSQQFINPCAAQAILERAYAGFMTAGDAVGKMLAASAVLDIIYVLRQGFIAAVAWTDHLQSELDASPVFPSPAIEAKVLSGLVSMLMFIRPQDVRLHHYADRLVVLLDDPSLGVNQKVWVASHALYYFTLIRGDADTVSRLLAQVWPLIEAPELSVVNNLFWRHQCMAAEIIMLGREQQAREAGRPIMSLIRDNNMPFLEVIGCLYEVLLLLRLGDVKAALPLLERMERRMNAALHPLDAAWLAFARFLYSVVAGDREAILEHGRSALEQHGQLGMLTIVMDINCILAAVRCDQGAPRKEIAGYLAVPARYEFGSSPRIRHQVLLVKAYAALLDGDRPTCRRHLRQALLVAERRPFFGAFFCWLPRQMLSRLCAEALRAGLEVESVRQAIRRHRLMPEDTAVDGWPWPVKVYSLGHFYLVRDGESRFTETRSQRKPINLLEVLIAHGGSDVPVRRITDTLWPDADGDAAVSAFTTTVSRLRKLIGHDALIVRRGRISLERRRCWVDVAALERAFQEAADTRDPSVLRRLGDQVLSLYRGPFMADEDGDWPRALREGLRTRLCRFLVHCVTCGSGQNWPTNLAERLEILDPGLEPFRNLIGQEQGPRSKE